MTTYSVYYTDYPYFDHVQPNLSLLVPLEFLRLNEALEAAFKIIYKGGIAWKIEGPQGLKLDRADIENEYKRFRTRRAA